MTKTLKQTEEKETNRTPIQPLASVDMEAGEDFFAVPTCGARIREEIEKLNKEKRK